MAELVWHNMRVRRAILWAVGIFSLLVGLVVSCNRFVLDWDVRPISHSELVIAFALTMHPSGEDDAHDLRPFPNVKGLSQDSLATLRDAMSMYGNMDWATNYNYVPGLREDDPGDLVLMYFNRPTRWTWFALPPTIFQEKEWIIIPVDFGRGMRPRPEKDRDYSERVSLDEFRRRLRETIDFVRTNDRPNWQTVVAEHTKFLDSLEQVKQ
jgi:hypothetical protein